MFVSLWQCVVFCVFELRKALRRHYIKFKSTKSSGSYPNLDTTQGSTRLERSCTELSSEFRQSFLSRIGGVAFIAISSSLRVRTLAADIHFGFPVCFPFRFARRRCTASLRAYARSACVLTVRSQKGGLRTRLTIAIFVLKIGSGSLVGELVFIRPRYGLSDPGR